MREPNNTLNDIVTSHRRDSATGRKMRDMKPIEIKHITKSINYINSLDFNEKITETEAIHQSQPHAFLTVLALSQDGVSMEKVDHALNVLMVIHKVFSDASNGLKIPLITKRMLDDALESNIAMLQTIDQGWLTTEESITSYFENNILAYLVGYLKEHDLISPNEEHERILINLKTVLDSYANARRFAKKTH